jgi:uncharacterized repeat protein (TIGR03943 family)
MKTLLLPFSRILRSSQPWWDVLAIGLLGLLLLHYWLSGKLNLLIHPNYHLLTLLAGLLLLGLAAWQGGTVWQRRKSARAIPAITHSVLLPEGWGSLILVGVAIVGFWVTPRAFASQTALQRGVSDSFGVTTQVRPQAFKGGVKPEARSLIDWMRTLQVYPEPDAYAGQAVKIQGFAVHPAQLSDQYFLLTQFTITCCAADAYPVSLPIKLRQGDRRSYKVDQWFEVEGVIISETLGAGNRQVVVDAKDIRPITEPSNPYSY